MANETHRSKLATLAYGAAAILCFVLAVYSLYFNRAATAGVAAAFALALILMAQLPIVESLEVLTLKVKLRDRLSDAEQLLKQLRESSSVSAKLMYVQLAFMNRMGTISWARKRVMLNEVDAMLRGVGVPDGDIAAFKRPFLNMVAFDLWRIFDNLIWDRIRAEQQRLDSQLSRYTAGGAIDPANLEYNRLMSERQALNLPFEKFDDILGEPQLADLDALTSGWMGRAALGSGDKERLEVARQEVVGHARASWDQGTVSEGAEAYLNEYSGKWEKRRDALFPKTQ